MVEAINSYLLANKFILLELFLSIEVFLCILLVRNPTRLLALIFLSCINKGFMYVCMTLQKTIVELPAHTGRQ